MNNKVNTFNENPNVAVLTTKQIINYQKKILYVTHDLDDGMWQFLDGNEPTMEEAALVSLHEIITIDKSVLNLYDLPLGWCAWRDDINQDWKRSKHD